MTITNLVDAMRVGESIEETTGQPLQLIEETAARIQGLLASPKKVDIGMDLEAFIREQVSEGVYHEVLDAVGRESGDGLRWQKDDYPMGHGDFLNAYAHPALAYGIALGLALVGDFRSKGVR